MSSPDYNNLDNVLGYLLHKYPDSYYNGYTIYLKDRRFWCIKKLIYRDHTENVIQIKTIKALVKHMKLNVY